MKTRASCGGWSMWMSSRGLGMLDCVAGCAVVKLRLLTRCIDKAEMHFLQPFKNERMLLRPSAVSRYAKRLIVTPLTTPQPYVCQLLAGRHCSLGSCTLLKHSGLLVGRLTCQYTAPKGHALCTAAVSSAVCNC